MGTVNRYCMICGSRLVYYPRLSNPKAPNEHRILVYGCMNCTRVSEKPTLLSLRISETDDPLKMMEISIIREHKANQKTEPPK